jgi:uncharacterized protein YggL (DUF469 family)
MLATKCIGLTEQGKKFQFIVVGEGIEECVKKANSYTFGGTKLKRFKTLLSIEVIGSEDNDTLTILKDESNN